MYKKQTNMNAKESKVNKVSSERPIGKGFTLTSVK